MSAILFDLDGTLVNSVEGIASSLSYAIESVGEGAGKTVDRRCVGPPLEVTVKNLLPGLLPKEVERVVARFKQHYDSLGYRQTKLFLGIEPMLAALGDCGYRLFVLTNKRRAVTLQILSHLRLSRWIAAVSAIDESVLTSRDEKSSKPERAVKFVASEGIGDCIVVGDGLDDLAAAERIGAAFFLAGWGYGAESVIAARPDVAVLNHPSALLAAINRPSRLS